MVEAWRGGRVILAELDLLAMGPPGAGKGTQGRFLGEALGVPWVSSDSTVSALRDAGVSVVREPADMPWGERVGFVTDPEGNLLALAASAGSST